MKKAGVLVTLLFLCIITFNGCRKKESVPEELTKDMTVKEMVECFDNHKLCAVDDLNQVDMVQREQVKQFVQSAKEKKEDAVNIYVIQEDREFLCYELTTTEGKVYVHRMVYEWKGGEAVVKNEEKFPSKIWSYTEKGYLFLEQELPEVYDGAPGQIAIRVEPLDQICRRYNAQYVWPVGYDNSQILSCDWNSADPGELDFSDLYEKTYEMEYGTDSPYEGTYGGDEYEIPKEEFEEPILRYLPFSPEVIENRSVYREDSKSFRFRPRGQYDSGLPYGPYPEVTGCEERSDGTVVLTVEGVWTRMRTDQAITSELTIQPLEDGGVKYLSNRVLLLEKNMTSFDWYNARLTEEEWTLNYPNAE